MRMTCGLRCKGVEEVMEAELAAGLEACAAEVDAFMRPLEAAAAAALERLRDAEARRARLADELDLLKRRVAGVE